MPVIRRCAKAATVDGERYHALEEPPASTPELLPELMAANIASVKIEGRQRSPAYVTRGESLAPAIDRCKADPQNFVPQSARMETTAPCPRDTNYPWRLSP